MSLSNEHSVNRAMNPWVLHLQKLGLELKCPLCLNLFKRPLLMPCDHLFCDSCIALTEFGSECPICKSRCADRDLRPLIFMENIVGIYRSLDAAFTANLSHSIEDGVGKTDKFDKCSIRRCISVKGYDTPNKDVVTFDSSEKVGLHVNQVDQASLSPPSSGDTKTSGNDSEHSLGNYSSKGAGKRNFDDMISQKQDNYFLGIDGHSLDSIGQKRLNYGELDMVVKPMDHCQTIQNAQNVVTSDCQLGSRNEPSLAVSNLPVTSDNLCGSTTICAFCQSSRMSEATGVMLHYLNGRPVTGDASFNSNVIHVHSSCIEWAPQVYYVGDSVKNLKAELARGAKLKCSRCGLKGAALGCYVKSCRRSDFLVLCPAHSSVKFPSEKSRKTHSSSKFPSENSRNAHSSSKFLNDKSGNCAPANDVMPNERSEVQPRAEKIARLGKVLFWKFLLIKFAKMIGVIVTKFWRSDVTHVIAFTDENGACTRTLKVLMAISNGKWVLNINWIKECMKAIHPLNEEPYEAPKLFNGFNFYFVGDFVSGYKEDLQNLVATAGGNILGRMEDLIEHNNSGSDQIAQTKTVLVYNLDAPQGSELGEEVTIIWQRVSEAEDLATRIGGQVIGHTWLLESIAACKLQPFVNKDS
ncbi:Breast cancer associated RING 1, putative isoform 3 [Hibiscus syriacus]|uniref:Breast cancer associated RING 1, putative isoform 3 n=1 Tax=Hibiscus syriacus TaxID=106335 RepID=A0A6A2Z0P7_HIBSY|nr:Breast cancer associated RING 1, putative isoform 3 [Hibiscus syriacus]